MRWTQEEIVDVIDLLKSGHSYKEISIIKNRSYDSIRGILNNNGEKCSNYIKKREEIICLGCGEKFNDIKSNKRKFCSKSCNASYNNKLRNKIECKVCLNCSKELKKDQHYKVRKYCNHICQNLYRRKSINERIENGDISLYEKNYKKYLIEKYGEKCMECSWDKIHPKTGVVPIQLEHIDGNSINNNLDNLKLLCPNCHSLTLTFGALNKGNGRKNRKR